MWLKKDDSYQVLIEEDSAKNEDETIRQNSQDKQNAREGLADDSMYSYMSQSRLDLKQLSPAYIKARGGGKVPLQKIIEMNKSDKK